MNSRILSAWVIGILTAALIASLGVWLFTRRAAPSTQTSTLSPQESNHEDVFSLPEEEGLLVAAGKPGPIPKLKNRVEEAIQRKRAVHLITLKLKGSLSDLMSEILNQTGIELDPGDMDMSRPVDLDVVEWPVRRVLNHVRLDVDHVWNLEPYEPRAGTKHAEGISLDFSLAPWEPEGKRLGWIVKTEARQDPNFGRPSSGWIEDSLTTTWDVAAVGAKDPIPFEICSLHSPGLVYVPQPDPGPFTVKVRGTRYWYLDIPIEFRDPKPTDIWKGRGFEISLTNWPNVRVKSDSPLPLHLLSRCLFESNIECYFKSGRHLRTYDSMGVGGGGGGGGRYGGRFGEKIIYAWCGCRNQPANLVREPVATGDTFVVSKAPCPGLSKFKSIQIDFRALMKEEFEVVSDPLATK